MKIKELDLKKMVVGVNLTEEIDAKGLQKKGYKKAPLFGWTYKTKEELNKLNTDLLKNNPEEYNMFYIILNKEYMVFDTDDETPYKIIKKYLKDNNKYNKHAITKSFRGKTLNIKYKRHFWFKVDNKEDFNDLKESAIVPMSGLEIFFGNKCFIGEFIETEIDEIPIINKDMYYEINELLNSDEKKLISRIPEKIEILSEYEVSETEQNTNKDIKTYKKQLKQINNIKSENTNINEDSETEQNTNKDIKTYKKQLKQINNIKSENTNINEEELKIILFEGLNIERAINYTYWWTILCIFINEKLNIDYFHEFSKRHPKYNKQMEKENKKIISNCKIKNNGYSIATLYSYVKSDNFEIFKKLCKKKDDVLFKNDLSNYSLAKLYFNLHCDDYIYTTELGWFEYNEKNILIHRGEAPLQLLNNISESLLDFATSFKNNLDINNASFKEKTNFLIKFNKAVGSTSIKKNIIDELKYFYEKKNIIEEMNKKTLFAFNNCLYDLNINKFRLIEKKDLISITSNYNLELIKENNEYIPKEYKEMKKKFKEIIFSIFENKNVMKYWIYSIAMTILQTKEECFFVHYGTGGNGKSLLNNIVQNTLGDYFKTVSNNFLSGSIKCEQASPELITCLSSGCRYISINEPDNTEGKQFNKVKIKELSGGTKIKARNLNSQPLEILPKFIMHIGANEIPKMSNKLDDGILRRIKIINYPLKFKPIEKITNKILERPIDYNLKDKIIKNKEFIQMVILKVLKYANKYKETPMTEPKEVLEMIQKYIQDNNDINEWFRDNIEITNDTNDKIKSSELLENYNNSNYCIKKLRPNEFSKFMEDLNIEKKRLTNGIYYYGIKYIIEDLF